MISESARSKTTSDAARQPVDEHGQRRVSFKLSHKGLLIVAIPLVFQIGFLGVLNVLLKQSEMEVDRQMRSKQIISLSDSVNKSFFEACLSMQGYSVTKSPLFLERYNTTIQQWPDELRRLKWAIGNNMLQQGTANEVESIIRTAQKSLDAERTTIDSASSDDAQFATRHMNKEIRSLADRLQERLQALTVSERRIDNEASAGSERARHILQGWLIIGVTFNVLLAAGAAAIFFRAISNRLSVLHDNSVRLSQNQQLHPQLAGEDEIADVDQAFHSMAAALTEASHKQESLIENARDVICSLDEKLTFLAVSHAALDIFGYEPDDLVGGNLMNLITDDDASAVLNNFKAVRAGGLENPFEIRIIHKSGSLVDVLLSAHWSASEGTIFCVAHDITERKGAERLRKEIVQMVTHDLRTPLTTVQHFHEMLAQGLFGPLDLRGQKTLEAAGQGTRRMLRLINDLLDIEKMEAGSLDLNQSLVELSFVFEQSVHSVLPAANAKGVRIECRPTTLTVYCDGERLIQVMVNLLSNAIKFTPPGARVVISAQQTQAGMQISVADEGRGIPASMLDTIFDRFKQVQVSDGRGRSGFGLGLAICKALVELHGGAISVESQEGMGATFTFRLPMREPQEKSTVRVQAELRNL